MKRIWEAVRRLALFTALMQKRTFFKPVFVVIMLLIPLLAAVFSGFSGQRGTTVTVCVYADRAEEGVNEVLESLKDDPGTLNVFFADSEEEAIRAVENREADGAWIFLPGFETNVRTFLDGLQEPVIRCIQREGSVYLSLGRERLYTMLFPYISRLIFASDMERLTGEKPSAEEVGEYYKQNVKTSELVLFEDTEGRQLKEENFVAAPARGLLAVLVLCAGMAAAILYAEDRERGVYDLCPSRALVFSGIFVPVFDLSAVSYAAILLLGQAKDPLAEACAMLLYAFACACLCLLLSEILRKPLYLGAALLPLILMTIAFTPIFFSADTPRALSFCFPTYHFLMTASNGRSFLYLAVYAFVCLSAALALAALNRRRKQ